MRAALCVLAVVVGCFIAAGVIIRMEEAPAAAPAPVTTGELVYRQGTYSYRLTDEPCPFEEFALELEAEGIPPARMAAITSGSRRFTGCWAKDIGGDVMTRQFNVEPGTLPLDGFKPEPPA